MKRWSRLFAFATIFSVTLLTTNVLPAQDTTEKTTKKRRKKRPSLPRLRLRLRPRPPHQQQPRRLSPPKELPPIQPVYRTPISQGRRAAGWFG